MNSEMVRPLPYHSQQVAAMAGGRSTSSRHAMSVSDVCIDSRACTEGSMFIALKGERCDGHDFLKVATDNGAKMVMVDARHAVRSKRLLQGKDVDIIVVEDTLAALQQFAASHVALFPQVTKVGVTGSCGKTTTKELIGSILSCMGKTAKTPGNFNSVIGLPLSVLQIDKDTKYGVFEMGIDHVGEMDSMLSVWQPHYSVLTNIGVSHMEKMGSAQTIASEKSKIFHSGLRQGYIAESCEWKQWIENNRNCSLQSYGHSSTAGLEYAQDLGLDGWNIMYEGTRMHLRCVGEHSLLDCFAAIDVARGIGASIDQIRQGIELMEPISGRSNVISGDVTIIEDCYNASLDSTGRILDYLKGIQWQGTKKAVLGSMKELGSHSVEAHEAIGRKLMATAPKSVFLFGKEMESAWKVMKASGFGSDHSLFYSDEYGEIAEAVQHDARKGDLFLLKGSRSMAMERLVPVIRAVS